MNRKFSVSFAMGKYDMERIEAIQRATGFNRSQVVRALIQEGFSTMRHRVKNVEQPDLIQNGAAK